MSTQQTGKISKKWKIVLFALGFGIVLGGLLTAWILITNTQTSNSIAKVYQNGTEIYAVDLSKVDKAYSYEVEGSHGERNVVLIEPGKISISEASCPDQVCVHTGAIEAGNLLPIVCLPNKVEIKMEGSLN